MKNVLVLHQGQSTWLWRGTHSTCNSWWDL